MRSVTARDRPTNLRGLPMNDSTAIAYLVGARPNFIKMAPLIAAMKQRAPGLQHVLINTVSTTTVSWPGSSSKSSDRRRPSTSSRRLRRPRRADRQGAGTDGAGARDLRPALFVVAGDVNSTLAGAVAAAKLEHPDRAPRSRAAVFDRTMPEEINRVLTDQIYDWCLTHSPEAEKQLDPRRRARRRVHFVGNTMIDTLVRLRRTRSMRRRPRRLGLARTAVSPRDTCTARPRRRCRLRQVTVARALRPRRRAPVVLPVHPRTRVRLGSRCAAHPEGSTSSSRWATSTSSRCSRRTEASSPTPAGCRKRPPSSGSRASRCEPAPNDR